MSKENVAFVQNAYDTFNRGDIQAVFGAARSGCSVLELPETMAMITDAIDERRRMTRQRLQIPPGTSRVGTRKQDLHRRRFQ
jgi:hypothetical protein